MPSPKPYRPCDPNGNMDGHDQAEYDIDVLAEAVAALYAKDDRLDVPDEFEKLLKRRTLCGRSVTYVDANGMVQMDREAVDAGNPDPADYPPLFGGRYGI